MARTQAPDYEKRREAIVDKAADLFASQGFNGASVNELAVACDASKSLIYHYYKSKEDILYAVMSSHVNQLLEDAERVQARKADARSRLRELIHSFMHTYAGAASRQKVLLNELDNLPTRRRNIVVVKQRAIIDAVRNLLVEIHPQLAIDDTRARVETMLLFGMINWTHTWYDPKGACSPEAIAEMALERMLAPMAI